MPVVKYSSYIIAFAATMVRYYDYALFGLSAAAIAKNLMPKNSDTNQMLGFFAVFSISVLARPLGAIIFGKIGDVVGRIHSIKIATTIAAISTSMVALIPTYGHIGILSVIFLILCRMLFLMSLAGEIDAIKIYVVEKIGKNKRHFASGIVSFSAQIGVLIAACMYHFSTSIINIDWFWRLNFLLGGFFGLLIILMRSYFSESLLFLKTKSRQKLVVNSKLWSIIKENKLQFTLAVIINGCLGGSYNFLIIFLGVFAANVAKIIEPELASENNIILIATYGLASLLSGFTADKVNQTKQVLAALLICLICTFIMQVIAIYGIFWPLLHILLAFCVPFYMIPTQVKLQSLFSTGVRMRMCSLSHSLGSMFFSATIPFFAMLLWKYTENFSIVISVFMIIVSMMMVASIYMNKKKYSDKFDEMR